MGRSNMTVELDGRLMTDRAVAHAHIQQQFSFPEYYGRNLDALYDLLTEISEPTQIHLLYSDALIRSLQTYGSEMLETFAEATEENPKLFFHVT